MLNELLLQESGFLHKFDQLESEVRNGTIRQLQQALLKQFKVELEFHPDQNLPAIFAGSAAVAAERDDNGIQPMMIEIGLGVTPDTKAGSVPGLLDNLRHELQHVHHMDDTPEEDRQDYHYPNQSMGGNVAYTYQYMERPSQILDLCTSLAAIDSNPDEFNKVVLGSMKHIDVQHDHEDTIRSAVQHEMSIQIDEERIDGILGTERHRHLLVVLHHASVMVMAKVYMQIADEAKTAKIRAHVNAFVRGVRKKFPEARAYYRKHSDDRQKSFIRTQTALQVELEKAEEGIGALLAEFMSQRNG